MTHLVSDTPHPVAMIYRLSNTNHKLLWLLKKLMLEGAPALGLEQTSARFSQRRRASTPPSNTLPQSPHNIPHHFIPIRLIQDLMPRRRVQLDRDIGHTGIPIPLPKLLQQDAACTQRVCVAGCDEDGQVAADAHALCGVGQVGASAGASAMAVASRSRAVEPDRMTPDQVAEWS